jgi:hypothetical protein
MQIDKILSAKLISTDYVYIDLWSVVHFIAGYMLYSYFNLIPMAAISLIVIYETIEPMFPFFKKEQPLDTLWDIVITVCGYLVAMRWALW